MTERLPRHRPGVRPQPQHVSAAGADHELEQLQRVAARAELAVERVDLAEVVTVGPGGRGHQVRHGARELGELAGRGGSRARLAQHEGRERVGQGRDDHAVLRHDHQPPVEQRGEVAQQPVGLSLDQVGHPRERVPRHRDEPEVELFGRSVEPQRGEDGGRVGGHGWQFSASGTRDPCGRLRPLHTVCGQSRAGVCDRPAPREHQRRSRHGGRLRRSHGATDNLGTWHEADRRARATRSTG